MMYHIGCNHSGQGSSTVEYANNPNRHVIVNVEYPKPGFSPLRSRMVLFRRR